MHLKQMLAWLIAITIATANSTTVYSQHETTVTRVFWQDHDTRKLSFANLTTTSKWNLKRGWVTGFPQLDATQQSLGEMQQAGGVILLGINAKNGAGGWLAVDSGVFEEPHGNHSHWRYSKPPVHKQSSLELGVGKNGAAYEYDDSLYFTDAGSPGFVRVVPNNLKFGSSNASRKFTGGGGDRISLAAINNSVAYAAHSDGEGESAGRVDVVSLLSSGDQPSYSFKLAAGNIRAATANSGKVFFAHAEGVSWVMADTTVSQSAGTVSPKALGRAAGAVEGEFIGRQFANQRNWVMYSSVFGETSALCLVNAAMSNPVVVELSVPMESGLVLTAPRVVLSLGKRYAFLFQERIDVSSEIQEQLTVVELDPNKDREFSDAIIKVTIPVGPSQVSDGGGHHDICFDAFGRHAVFTEPSDGLISVMSLQSMGIVARFQVGGTPDRIIAVGAAEHSH